MKVVIEAAQQDHVAYATEICDLMAMAAAQRGTGIAKRTPEYITGKINEGKAVIALEDGKLAGFCYIESWGQKQYVANSGLIVAPDYRRTGLAKRIKAKIFELSRQKYPDAKIFGITTSLAVMKINSDLGYKPVTFSELTTDESFWKGCKSCPNYDILQRTQRSHCLCTGMLYQPKNNTQKVTKQSRWEKFKKFLKLNSPKKYSNEK